MYSKWRCVPKIEAKVMQRREYSGRKLGGERSGGKS